MRIPALRLRLCILAQVTIRSPIPVSPEKVSGFPPITVPRRVISAIPLVISAAFVLSPQPRPSAVPAARAITFFKAPPSSIPSMSGLVYTRNTGLINRLCTYSAAALLWAPVTQVVGRPLLTSSAWLGPESTVTSAWGSSSSITSDNVFKVASSIPFATFVTI